MKKRYNTFYWGRCFLLGLFLGSIIPAASAQYWERLFGPPETYEYIHDLFEAYDKGYVMGTVLIDEKTPGMQEFTMSGIIYKTTINGDNLWYRNLRKEQDLMWACRPVGDGSMVALLVSTNPYNKDGLDTEIILTRIDACGNQMWCREIIDGIDCGYGALDMQIINNRIVFCGQTFCDDPGTWFDIVMFDLDGNKICNKPFLFFNKHPMMNSPFLNRILPLPNNEFMMLGRVYYKANPHSPAWLRALFVKFDAEGNEQWVLPFGLRDTLVSFSSICEHVVMPKPGRYFAFNCFYSTSIPLRLMLMKFKDDGHEDGFIISEADTLFGVGTSPAFCGSLKMRDNQYLNLVQYNLPDDPNHVGTAEVMVDSTDISHFSDTLQLGGYTLILSFMHRAFDMKILTGGYDISYGDIQAYLNKVSPSPLSFDTMYTKPYTYDSLCPDIAYADTIYFDNCQVLVGNNDIQHSQPTKTPITLYPNPAYEELTVSLGKATHTDPIAITIHTLTGEIQWQGTLEPGEQTRRLSILSWPKGLYLVTARNGSEVVGRGKVIIM
ncbi:MAG: hypothetical protein CSA95_04550 [Bacteroidetes bacterium]|nr:MAG: hypothetical protein CSA95_04550 [Bacteroidota bacterium]